MLDFVKHRMSCHRSSVSKLWLQHHNSHITFHKSEYQKMIANWFGEESDSNKQILQVTLNARVWRIANITNERQVANCTNHIKNRHRISISRSQNKVWQVEFEDSAFKITHQTRTTNNEWKFNQSLASNLKDRMSKSKYDSWVSIFDIRCLPFAKLKLEYLINKEAYVYIHTYLFKSNLGNKCEVFVVRYSSSEVELPSPVEAALVRYRVLHIFFVWIIYLQEVRTTHSTSLKNHMRINKLNCKLVSKTRPSKIVFQRT